MSDAYALYDVYVPVLLVGSSVCYFIKYKIQENIILLSYLIFFKKNLMLLF